MIELPNQLLEEIKSNSDIKIVGVSGFGGAGKSTASKLLAEKLGANLVGIDSFQKSQEYSEYSNWEIMDYARMKKEVIIPFLERGEGVLIIEGVGLFRPDLIEYFDYKIWIDVPLDQADARGRKRDEEVYKNLHADKFYDLWRKNDEQCYESYKPQEIADYIVRNY